jgi:D-amino-acid dehydrogenase
MKWLFMKHAPLILRPKLDTSMLTWMARMLTNCTADRYAINKSRKQQLFRTQQQLDASGKEPTV